MPRKKLGLKKTITREFLGHFESKDQLLDDHADFIIGKRDEFPLIPEFENEENGNE